MWNGCGRSSPGYSSGARFTMFGLKNPCGMSTFRSSRDAGNNRPVQSTIRSFDLAHLAHVELLTPRPEESLHFFRDVMGMTESGRRGDSVYLRGGGDYEHHTLKLTAAKIGGLGHYAFRATSPDALGHRVAIIEQAGYGKGWTEGDLGHGPAYAFTTSDGHDMEI